MERVVAPEWLDRLEPDDRLARANRTDLWQLNQLVGTAAWFQMALEQVPDRPKRLVEIGAGDGGLSRALQKGGWECDGLDVWPAPVEWPAERAWHRVKVESFNGWSDYDGVCANLFLHQLEDATLAELGRRWAAAGIRAVVTQEPWRSGVGRVMFLLAAAALGLGEVSRHDGWVSVNAGFDGAELPERLGLGGAGWAWEVRRTGWGLYRMAAWRVE